MTMLCSLVGHTAGTTHHHNLGLDFCLCHHCGCDLIRAEAGNWTEVPKGFRVVWREFGRAGGRRFGRDADAAHGAGARVAGIRGSRGPSRGAIRAASR
ncbi:MAG: hypothetical protein WDN44_02420 [Sphingomonas sp.]